MSKQREASTRLREFIAPAFAELSIALTPAQLEEITELVAGSMVGAGRFFHTPEHVIHVGSGGDAISVLAAFFHDLVYFQVDQGVGINVARHIAPFIFEKDEELLIRTDIDYKRFPFVEPITKIFGFKAGDTLSTTHGLNEYLSALAAASVLSPFMNLSQLVQIAVCIECTIPFRQASAKGESAAELLFERLKTVCTEYKLPVKGDAIPAIVRRAVKMANQDVSNFGGESATRFLKNTWELVPEINPMLRSRTSYTVEGYRQALQKMERFFSTLNPARVFQKFDSEPDDKLFWSLSSNATRHVEEARFYFRLKLMSLGMLEALSGTLGKNLGLPILMGELSDLGSPEDRVEKFLPRLEPRPASEEIEGRLLQLLEKSTQQQEEVGLKSSPLTAFLVRTIGFRPMLKIWSTTESYFDDKADARELLEAFPMETVGYVSDAVSVLLQRRAHRIVTFVGSLHPATT